ncbi:MAG: hypothetical protein C4520_20330 [Candidatus Abyssobacteria bacterium SURF_5]|uniref:Uncharacterized protein n=1 Tax=Abyssobacteria bacterium (strain SURF_5) TaxID=2093360 RepID=A0A3A4MZH5_ABYX5|nr:MAG: hypothetical protein C4520_20330 [Candidatus Abyssubacteria bacterium SURF_5]
MKTSNRIHTFQFLPLRDAIYLGFCATFIIITRAMLRLHLNIPGHAMFFTMFFLILGRACVPYRWAATLMGVVAGTLSMLLGMGKGGPLVISKSVFPAVIVDVGFTLCPRLAESLAASVLLGCIASATRFFFFLLVDWLLGMEKTIMLQHAIYSSILTTIFGGVGSAMVPAVVRRLKAHQLIS